MLNDHLIPRCYYPRDTKVKTIQLHGSCDASESAYAAVAYLKVTDIKDSVTTSLVITKTKVSPNQETNHSPIRALWGCVASQVDRPCGEHSSDSQQ